MVKEKGVYVASDKNGILGVFTTERLYKVYEKYYKKNWPNSHIWREYHTLDRKFSTNG